MIDETDLEFNDVNKKICAAFLDIPARCTAPLFDLINQGSFV